MVKYLTKGILSVAGSGMHQICLFSLFIFSNLSVYLMSYLHHQGNQVRLENGYFLGTICSFTMNGFNFLGGVLDNKFKVHITILTGSGIIALACTGLIFSKNLYLTYALMVFFGLGFGIACMTSFKNACRFFPNKQGIVTAIIGACGNAGSSLFNFVASQMINPDKAQIDKITGFYSAEISNNYIHYLYLKLGCIFGMSIIASLMIFQYKSNEDFSLQLPHMDINNNEILDMEEPSQNDLNTSQLEASVGEIDENGNETSKKTKSNNYGKDVKKALRSGRIWYLFILFFSCSFGTNIIATTFFTFGTKEGVSNTILTNTSIIYFTSSCVIGLIWGTIFDKFGFKSCILIITILGMICSTSFFYARKIPYLFASLVILNGGLSSGTFSILFPHVLTVFTPVYSTETYGVVSMSVGSSSLFSAIFAFFVTKVYVDLNNTAYQIVYLLGAGFSALALVLGIFESGKQFDFGHKIKP